ncbi:MAG TPA: carboxypeptidase-like regulatory domain-containing protein, partial [Chitinophagaceae bacterium]|nr:carboxypeptidase-like regulatory domain-containing protein [Chitinophagaceae bacterium]
MRKFASLFVTAILCSMLVYAQNRTVSGQITDANGKNVPFASVLIKGSKVGTNADNEGMFSLKNVKTGTILVISSTGYSPKEVNTEDLTFIKVEMSASTDASLKEVVVTTAYGIKRSLRATTTNTQVVSSDQLNTIRNNNINEAIAGKVAGIQLRGQSGAKLTSTGAIRNHGANSLGGASALLYVLDGNRVAADDINTDDIEDITLLQGPAAAAIFGPEGANGAMVVTSKKGRKSSGLGIDINLGIRFDRVYILPNYQNTYAGGDFYDMKKYTWTAGQPVEWKALDGKYYPDYS